MKIHFEKLKKEIPEEYHFLLHDRLCDTDTMSDKFRVKNMNGANFNKCEKCGYDLLTSKAYKAEMPTNGFVNYYHRHKKILCDRCTDELNGHPWGR